MSVELDISDLDFSRMPPEMRSEFERRFRLRTQLDEAQGFLADLHPAQRRFIEDKSRRKVALCSRRAGKSYLILAWLIEGALDDRGGMSVYVARSKGAARKILGEAIAFYRARWPLLGLELRERDGQLELVVGLTGHVIWLAGAKDQAAIDKFRGPKYKRVAIDEAQEYGLYLESLVVDVFEPALLDKQGDLALCGTPGPVPAGLFFEVSTGDGKYPKWDVHHWTIYENPHIRNADEEVDSYLARYGLSKTSASYRREYKGEWVRDAGALVYPFDDKLNGIKFDQVPSEGLRYCLGVDIGYTDPSAFIVTAIAPGQTPNIYILESWKRENLTPTAVAKKVAQYIERYGRGLRVVIDEGGIGKGYSSEMRVNHAIACEAAEKTRKRVFQETVGDELTSGTIKIVADHCKDLIDEMQTLQWGPGHEAEDERFENHCCDALLYSVRASRTWFRPKPPEPVHGSDEWHKAEAAKQRQAMIEIVRKRNRKKGWRR